MQNKFDIKEYKKIHNGNLKTLLQIYWNNKPIWKSYFFWIALILSLISLLFVYLSNSSFYNLICFLSNEILSIMPNILGFNLGGYVLLIGLNSQNILDEITEPIEPSKYSLFQKQSSVFAFSILIQATSILISFFFLGISKFGENTFMPHYITFWLNLLAFFIIVFISLYSIFLIGQIVLNIFNFGQMLHFFIRLERLENENIDVNKTANQ